MQLTGLLHGLLQGGVPVTYHLWLLALHLTQQPPQHGALAVDRLAQTLELARMRIAACLAQQLRPFAHKGLLEGDARLLGGIDQLAARHLQQTAVGGMSHGLGLYRRVHHYGLQVLLADQLELHGQLHGLRQQLFHAFFSDELAELDQQAAIAGRAWLEVGQTARVRHETLQVLDPYRSRV